MLLPFWLLPFVAADVRVRHRVHHWTPEDLPVLLPGTQGEGDAVLLRGYPGGPRGMAHRGDGAGDVWSIPAVWVSRGRGRGGKGEGHIIVHVSFQSPSRK